MHHYNNHMDLLTPEKLISISPQNFALRKRRSAYLVLIDDIDEHDELTR